jgi:hypothetical protein
MQHDSGMPLQQLAAHHQRTERAIKQRIKVLLLLKRFINGLERFDQTV